MKSESFIELRPSPIHGTGVFALKTFAPGEIVLRWDISQIIPMEEFLKLPASEQEFSHPFDAEKMIVVQSPERFVNHSCDHNTVVRDFCDVAVRRILPGEEITGDYSSDGGGRQFSCSCGAENCGGAVDG